MIRVALITNVIPSYRNDFYQLLFASHTLSVKVYCQARIPGLNLATVGPPSTEHIRFLGSWTAPAERISWQHLPVRELWRDYDVLVFYGNPRIFSSLLWSSLFRAFGKPVVLWGQAHAHHAFPPAESLRLAWWRRFRHLLVYNDAEAQRLRARGFRHHTIIGINNGLNQERIDAMASGWTPERLEAWRRDHHISPQTPLLLSIGRLEPKCRFELLADSLACLTRNHPNLLWVVIGDGPEAPSLKRQVCAAGLEPHVRWLGAVYDEGHLAPWFLSATALVHPGAIGLALLHAFGYGLPVVTHRDESAHGPEFTAMQDEVTGRLFAPGDRKGLVHAIERLLDHPDQTRRMGQAARRRARESYNITVMSERFHAIVTSAYHERSPWLRP